MIPKSGDSYKAKLIGPIILKNRGMKGNSEWIITCTEGDKISLSLYKNNPGGWFEITIAKVAFGENFEKMPSTIMGKNYISNKHFHPDVNERTLVFKPL